MTAAMVDTADSKGAADGRVAKLDDVIATSLLLVIQVAVAIACGVIKFHYSTTMDAGGYGYFRDVSLMIFFGFGFLMTFLQNHGLSAIGYCLVISALVVEMSIVVEYIVMEGHKEVTLETLLNGLFCAGAVMISYGAVLGKVTPLQLVVMSIFEVFAFWANARLCLKELGAHDVGGGMVIHTFGAYFGLAATWWVSKRHTIEHPAERSSYSSDIFSLAGTVLLWVLWPSFQAAVAGDPQRQSLAVCNTFLSLCSSTLAFAVVSRLLSNHKFDVVHLQNATLAGGVAMGVAGDMDMGLHGAMLSGFAAGALSCFGYAKVHPLLMKLNIHDTCGVNNLHGMPGILSAIIGVIVTLQLGDGAADAAGPLGTKGFPGIGADKQAYALLVTVAMGLGCGALAGFFMSVPLAKLGVAVPEKDCFRDALFFAEASAEQAEDAELGSTKL